MKFEKYHISEDIKQNLAQLGFKRPTDIQFKSIPLIDKIHREKSSKRDTGIKSLVMAPTRELATQIGEVFTSIAKHTHVKPFALIGGIEQDAQLKKLQEGIDILITTPGRMFDLIHQGYISLARVDTLVLDEADHMLDLGFIKDIQYVKKCSPENIQSGN